MSRERQKRVARLLDLRTRDAETARAELGLALRRTESALALQEESVIAWRTRADAMTLAPPDNVDDLIASHEHLDGLMRHVHAAEQEVATLREAEAQRREALTVAERELKKIELWRDGLAATARQQEARRERFETDEIAARNFAKEDA